MKIEKLFRYPIKSLAGESMDQAFLQAGKGLAGDRQFALTHATSKFVAANPAWLHRRNFVTLARSPQMHHMTHTRVTDENTGHNLLRVSCRMENGDDTILFDANSEQSSPLAIENPALDELLMCTQPGPHTLVSASGHSLWDAPFASVSLFNLASLEELAKSTGMATDMTRFRGNIWFSGIPAWQELDWLDATLTIAKRDNDSSDTKPALRLRIVERIERCRVINTDPATGKKDVMLTRHLLDTYGHCDFGVHAVVIGSGHLRVGEQLALQVSPPDKDRFTPPF